MLSRVADVDHSLNPRKLQQHTHGRRQPEDHEPTAMTRHLTPSEQEDAHPRAAQQTDLGQVQCQATAPPTQGPVTELDELPLATPVQVPLQPDDTLVRRPRLGARSMRCVRQGRSSASGSMPYPSHGAFRLGQ